MIHVTVGQPAWCKEIKLFRHKVLRRLENNNNNTEIWRAEGDGSIRTIIIKFLPSCFRGYIHCINNDIPNSWLQNGW